VNTEKALSLYFWCTGAALFHQEDHHPAVHCTLAVVANFRLAAQTWVCCRQSL